MTDPPSTTSPRQERQHLRTHGGRCLGVDRLDVDGTARIGRVVMSVTCLHEERDTLWASLTAPEARELAAQLLEHAAALEHDQRAVDAG